MDDKPRFLAPITRNRDYVDNPAMAVRGEPECIGPAIVDGYASVANFHRSQQHALHVAEAQLRRPHLEPEDRVKDITRRAKHAHVNLSRETWVINVEVGRARKGGRKVPGRVLRRLEKLEGLLDGIDA